LDGSAKASADLATKARSVLGGRIDILVNNAGIFPRSTTATTDEATFDEVYAVNVKAPYFLTGAIAPAMADAGQGAIINLGSWIARLGIPSALYSSTKGAVETRGPVPLEEFRLSRRAVVVLLARFPGGEDPAFAQRLEPFLPAEQPRGLARPDLARCGNCHRDAGSGHIVGCLIHDDHVILPKGKPRHHDRGSQVLQGRPDHFHRVLRLLKLIRH
jgi:hypothetical protein